MPALRAGGDTAIDDCTLLASSYSIEIKPEVAARALALPMLARSAMRTTGRVHFLFALVSSRITASTAIASVVQEFSHVGRHNNGRCQKSTAPQYHTADGRRLTRIFFHGDRKSPPAGEIIGTISGVKLGDVQNGQSN
jgi:hypothetical protein